MIDLHTHSTCSDGSDRPSQVADLAAAAGCRAFSLTDHDTLSGQGEARARAAELGIDLVPGCEVSCLFRDKSVHVLVYFVEEGEGPLQDELERLRQDRVTRNARLVDRLRELGLPITLEEVEAEAGGPNLGRPHFAAVLVRNGAATDIQDAFDRWLGTGTPGYIKKARITPAEVARAAGGSGGVAVLAHPFTTGLTGEDLAGAVGELAGAGLTGIEAYYGRYSPEERQGLIDLARRFDLVATGGSDHHGSSKPDLTVGTGRGDLEVPDDVLDRLEDRRPA